MNCDTCLNNIDLMDIVYQILKGKHILNIETHLTMHYINDILTLFEVKQLFI